MSDNLDTLDWMRECISEGTTLSADTTYQVALEWAIDQLRWRRVDEEWPPAQKGFEVEFVNAESRHLVHCTMTGETLADSTTEDLIRRGFTHWRPLDVPEEQ